MRLLENHSYLLHIKANSSKVDIIILISEIQLLMFREVKCPKSHSCCRVSPTYRQGRIIAVLAASCIIHRIIIADEK